MAKGNKKTLKYDDRLKEQASNRLKLLAKLKPKTRDFAVREFAKLGLFQ